MKAIAYILLTEAVKRGECLISLRHPSQIYADYKGYGKAHRIVWEAVNGPIPEGMFVCHTCDVPRCVNIDHLFLGTAQDNMNDKMSKGRWAGGRLKLLDHRHYEQVITMRYEGKTYAQIGAELLVSRRTVERFVAECPHD